MRFEGKVAVVFGGGQGIGKATGMMLARQGAKVVVLSRTKDDLSEVVRNIEAEGGVAIGFVVDVRDQYSIKNAFVEIQRYYSNIDIMVYSAGILDFQRMTTTSLEEIQKIFATNLFGAVSACQNCIPIMQRQGNGSIVIVSAVGALHGGGIAPVYRASKAALNNVSEAFAEECLPLGIRINVVCPSEVKTRMASKLGKTDEMSHWMDPSEVADVIGFLCSDESRSMTGATLIVRGRYQLSR